MHLSSILTALGAITVALAIPMAARPDENITDIAERTPNSLKDPSVNSITEILAIDQAKNLVARQANAQAGNVVSGVNARSNNGKVWIGDDGYMRFHIQNTVDQPIQFVLWVGGSGWVSKSAINPQQPEINIPMNPHETIVISAANHVGGVAFAAVYPNTPVPGQIENTWIEFSTSGWDSTIDISRLPNMSGHWAWLVTPLCWADHDHCAYVCKNGLNRCGAAGEYDLLNCQGFNLENGQPGGGCPMGDGGEIQVGFA